MSNWRGRHRLDANQNALKDRLEAMGYYWWDGSGVDGILVKAGRLVPVEVKNPDMPPSKRKLTPHEAEIHQMLKANGVRVEMLTDEASLDVLMSPRRNSYKHERPWWG